MTEEQIEEKAQKYGEGMCDCQMVAENAFIAGAECRQAEIDELVRWLDSIVYCYENHEIEDMQKVKEILKKYEL